MITVAKLFPPGWAGTERWPSCQEPEPRAQTVTAGPGTQRVTASQEWGDGVIPATSIHVWDSQREVGRVVQAAPKALWWQEWQGFSGAINISAIHRGTKSVGVASAPSSKELNQFGSHC